MMTNDEVKQDRLNVFLSLVEAEDYTPETAFEFAWQASKNQSEKENANLKQERDLLQSRLQYAKEQALIAENIEKRLMQQLKDAEVQRDEAVAMVEVMRDVIGRYQSAGVGNSTDFILQRDAYVASVVALSITPSAALAEIQARKDNCKKCVAEGRNGNGAICGQCYE